MAFFAVIDETGLERRLDARHDGLVDVALALFAPLDLGLEIEQFLAIDNGQATLFGLRRVDQHAFHVFVHSKTTESVSPQAGGITDARETRQNRQGIALDCGDAR